MNLATAARKLVEVLDKHLARLTPEERKRALDGLYAGHIPREGQTYVIGCDPEPLRQRKTKRRSK